MIMNNRELLSYVHSQGVSAKLIIYPELSHGEVFGASLKDILMNKLFNLYDLINLIELIKIW